MAEILGQDHIGRAFLSRDHDKGIPKRNYDLEVAKDRGLRRIEREVQPREPLMENA